MPFVAQLLEAPALSRLRYLGGNPTGREVESVTLVHGLQDLRKTDEGAFAVIADPRFDGGTDYRIDIAMRLAGSRSVAAVALNLQPPERVPSTAERIAQRAELAIVSMPPDVDLGALCASLGQEIRGGATAAICRTKLLLSALLRAEAENASPPQLVNSASEVLGTDLALLHEERRGPLSAPVLVDGAVDGHIVANPRHDFDSTTLELVVHLVAAFAGRSLSRERRQSDLPMRSRAQLLTELLLAPPERSSELAGRALQMKLPIDRWNLVARLEMENVAALTGGNEIQEFELGEHVTRLALDSVGRRRGMWHSVRLEPALLLHHLEPINPGPTEVRNVKQAVASAIEAITERFPDLVLLCGVGGFHPGIGGLRASAAEARSAVASARTSGRVNTPVTFDASGLRRILIEWYASDSAREGVKYLLEPLDHWGPERAEVAIHTLRVYLDEQGSLARAAKKLHLHRNAVAYRIKKIFDVLDIDLADPDQRLALQIACRARALG
jgi:sugar diacid utilization regulator